MIYRIPLLMRRTYLDGAQAVGHEKQMCVDGIGFFVRYLPGQEKLITPRYMRRFLMMREDTHCVIRARRVEDALDIFYSEFERKGDDRKPERKSLWIDAKGCRYIEEVYCPDVRIRDEKGKRFEVSCGGFGESFAGCILDDYDPPSDDSCPIACYREAAFELEQHNQLPTRRVRGFKLLRMKDVMALEL